ncbi:alpha/beta fold hydrolase [Streptomyces roseirectus]|uniref:Alpha/beta fold hydrolase n=1 Tax=Streptomyces roseirectus TaxID=2768066 RepID=A0A7H0I6V4_9ACTN|nr:alpha/beta hydrolase [Streptomyces roseirectus]QNP68520.1 alpha/beta fold hydrolase [Streptomyces roseirectus]
MPTFTALDGTELAYHVRGEGPPLIVLPGGPMVASAYLGDLGGLTAHRTLFFLDLRGTGDSATPADPSTYRCDRQVDDVEALRAHLALDRVDLLGHSAAGNLALLYAARHPTRVARLALIAVTPRALGLHATDEDHLTAARLREGEDWFEEAYAHLTAVQAGERAFDLEAVGGFVYGRWDEAARAHLALMEALTNDEASDLFHAPDAYDPPATLKALARLDAPVLLLSGERDGAPSPALTHRAAALLPRAEAIVQPGAGHLPWIDDPERFVRGVNGFLRSAE